MNIITGDCNGFHGVVFYGYVGGIDLNDGYCFDDDKIDDYLF